MNLVLIKENGKVRRLRLPECSTVGYKTSLKSGNINRPFHNVPWSVHRVRIRVLGFRR